jgi:AraC-like DNA-binding protein
LQQSAHGEERNLASKALERLCIEVARQRVQSSSEAIECVAEITGFRDPERMRRALIRAFGQPPQSLRRALSRCPNINEKAPVMPGLKFAEDRKPVNTWRRPGHPS